MANPKVTAKKDAVEIKPIEMRQFIVHLVGANLIMHRFAQKAWQELLLPAAKVRTHEGAPLKHDPLSEFRDALYRCRDITAPTLFHLPHGIVSKAMAAAALDMGGAAKAQIQRLTMVLNPTLHLYGVPQLGMHMVRQSDMSRTPDVRTRPIFRRWALPNVLIQYKVSPLNDGQMLNLLAGAGQIVGFGDSRQQKGGGAEGGPFGCFRIVSDRDDPELIEIMATGDRAAQQAAWNAPEMFDENTAELMEWFTLEIDRRHKQTKDGPKPTRRRRRGDGDAAQMGFGAWIR